MSNTNEFENFAPNSKGKLKVPELGDLITVTLPGEILRAEVTEVVDNDHITCKLSMPMARSHTHKKDDLVKFHRAKGMVREYWEADSAT